VVLQFDHAIAKDQQAAVEKRLFVTATPAQPGSWYWFSGTEVHYRPQNFWQPSTKILVRAALGGVPMGDNRYGKADLTLDLSVVDKPLSITVDDTTKMLTVTQDGAVVKTMPASLGKDSTPSSSGHMVIMSREPSTIFDSSTSGIPVNSPGGYRETVLFAMRLTWGGQYIHAAPWSVGQQGSDDVSHGCTNVSTENAKWIYENSHVGDPVTVEHTKRGLDWGDGWTDWDRDWAGYQQGSALPHTASPYDYTAPHN
jgi:lipoprotein-anchoring transpeptidase ErfK/SrfK